MGYSKPVVIASELAKSSTATVASLAVQLDLSKAAETYAPQIESISANYRASCYLAAAQIFLKSNATLERDLVAEDVKERLLGHWVRNPLNTLCRRMGATADDLSCRERLEESP